MKIKGFKTVKIFSKNIMYQYLFCNYHFSPLNTFMKMARTRSRIREAQKHTDPEHCFAPFQLAN